MRKVVTILAVALCLTGCAADPGSWDAVKRDLRGDNSQMSRGWDRYELPKATMSAR